MSEADFAGLSRLGLLLEPEDADTPILNLDIRGLAHAWIHEQNEEAREALQIVGAKPRKTMLFYGPPGTGKTTLAHHLCARIGIRMLLVSSHDILASYLGESEQKISALFKAATKVHDDIVIFLDEIDGLTPKRTDGGSRGGASEARNSMLITFMRMIDRYPGIIIAATNRYDAIDPALLRRIEMKIPIEVPTPDIRRLIIVRYLAPMELSDHAIDTLNSLLMGASPALVRQLMEGLKRDLVMARLLGQPHTARDVFGRLRAGIQPADLSVQIPFWDGDGAMEKLSSLPWPPTWPGSDA